MTPHKTPQRSCISCRKTEDRQRLVRFVRTTDGTVELDRTGKMRGRGAYLCATEKCFEEARRRRKLNAALKMELLDDDYDRLERDFMEFISGIDAQ